MKNLNIPAVILCAAMSSVAQSEDKAGGTPVCMALPRVAVGDGAPVINSFSERLREQIATTLAGPMVEPRKIDSRLAIQARAEASNLKCHYLLTVNFTHAPNSKIGKRSAQTAMEVGQVATNVASTVGAVSSRTSNAMGAASSIGGLFGNRSSSDNRSEVGNGFYAVGKNDKIAMTYSLELVDGDAVVKKGEFAGKVSKDNEPLVDTYIEKLASDVLQAVAQ
jgi:hypothetical protein